MTAILFDMTFWAHDVLMLGMNAEREQQHAWLGLKRNRIGLAETSMTLQRLLVGDMLERQRASHGVPAWDWKQTSGLNKKKIWNALELALLADFPSKIQVCGM